MSEHHTIPHFVLSREGKEWKVMDQDGQVYGRYDNKTEAQEALEGWEGYYGSCANG